ncbi:MAG: glycoside hydrolase family 31 protein [Chlorobi bacterium]|nr:glycoside hydrolase family 31 protein [Chlorobiota bacterium]
MTKIKRDKKLFRGLFILIGLLLIILYFIFILPVWGYPFNKQRHGNPPRTPAWALECWLWEDDMNTARRVDELLTGYAENDIPVRTILIDSPWSLRYNDYEVDTMRYPRPAQWFKKLQDNGYRVVLWTTSMVNSYSKDTRIQHSGTWFNHARDKGYLAGGGYQIGWWKGKGAFIDYTSPEAMKWWHGMQQQVFNYGIDGWKLDGTGTLFRGKRWHLPVFFQQTRQGCISTRNYMDHYYRDEYLYGLKQNPDFITLSRAIDRGYHPEGFAPVDASPVNWVGDQEHYWESDEIMNDQYDGKPDIALKGIQGLESAIDNILKSAKTGYSVVGSDVAGFSGAVIPPRLYIRWAEFSAFCGLFLNGGHGERALWKRSKQEMEIIRKYAWLHTELVPYMYSYVVQAHNGGSVLQRPVAGKYQYMFGENILVAPVYKDDPVREVSLPAGKWRYWFDNEKMFQGPETFSREYPLDEFPVFIREGAIIPMNIERSYTGIGNKNSKGYITFLIFPDADNTFTFYQPEKGRSTSVAVKNEDDRIKISLTGDKISHILNVHLSSKPVKIELDEKLLTDSLDYHYIQDRNKLIIKTDHYNNGVYTITK